MHCGCGSGDRCSFNGISINLHAMRERDLVAVVGEGVIGVRACVNVCIHVCDRKSHTHIHTHTHTYTHTEGETAEHASLTHQMKKNNKNVYIHYSSVDSSSLPLPKAAGRRCPGLLSASASREQLLCVGIAARHAPGNPHLRHPLL